MNAAVRIAFEEFGDRGIRPRRFDQLDPGGAELDIGKPHALLGVFHARSDRKSVFLVELPGGGRDVRHDDGDVVQTGDHDVTLAAGRAVLR